MKITKSTKTTLDLVIPFGLGGFAFWYMYQKTKDIKSAGILAVVAAAVAYVITTQLTKKLMEATIDSISAGKEVEIATQYSLSTAEISDCKEVASQVYHAFNEGWSEDETAAIDAMNRCSSAGEVKAVCDIYQAAYKKSVKAEFDSYVHFWDGSVSGLVSENWY